IIGTNDYVKKKYSELLNTFRNESFFIIDEFDSLYNPLESTLNFPLSDNLVIDEEKGLVSIEYWEIMINFISYIFSNKNNQSITDLFNKFANENKQLNLIFNKKQIN